MCVGVCGFLRVYFCVLCWMFDCVITFVYDDVLCICSSAPPCDIGECVCLFLVSVLGVWCVRLCFFVCVCLFLCLFVFIFVCCNFDCEINFCI